jgi:glycerol-3-phosphate dehydrogenase
VATALSTSNGGVDGIELTSTRDGSSASVRTWSVINASGPWADTVLATLGVTREPMLRLNQGTHLVYPRLAEHAMAFEHPEDRRLCFTVPWQDATMVGTTEVDIDGDPGAARVTPEEVRYLKVAVRNLFPAAEAVPIWASVGVRSLFRGEREATRVSRRHLLVDHGDDGVHGLVTVAGGKLTAWRSIAAEVVNDVLRERDHGATHPNRAIGRPVAATPPAADATSQRLWRLYGRRAGELTEWTERDGWWGERLLPGGDAIRAEVAHAVEREWASTLGDVVLRRLALGSGPDLGQAAAAAAGAILVARLGWEPDRVERDLADLDAENAERQLPALV